MLALGHVEDGEFVFSNKRFYVEGGARNLLYDKSKRIQEKKRKKELSYDKRERKDFTRKRMGENVI